MATSTSSANSTPGLQRVESVARLDGLPTLSQFVESVVAETSAFLADFDAYRQRVEALVAGGASEPSAAVPDAFQPRWTSLLGRIQAYTVARSAGYVLDVPAALLNKFSTQLGAFDAILTQSLAEQTNEILLEAISKYRRISEQVVFLVLKAVRKFAEHCRAKTGSGSRGGSRSGSQGNGLMGSLTTSMSNTALNASIAMSTKSQENVVPLETSHGSLGSGAYLGSMKSMSKSRSVNDLDEKHEIVLAQRRERLVKRQQQKQEQESKSCEQVEQVATAPLADDSKPVAEDTTADVLNVLSSVVETAPTMTSAAVAESASSLANLTTTTNATSSGQDGADATLAFQSSASPVNADDENMVDPSTRFQRNRSVFEAGTYSDASADSLVSSPSTTHKRKISAKNEAQTEHARRHGARNVVNAISTKIEYFETVATIKQPIPSIETNNAHEIIRQLKSQLKSKMGASEGSNDGKIARAQNNTASPVYSNASIHRVQKSFSSSSTDIALTQGAGSISSIVGSPSLAPANAATIVIVSPPSIKNVVSPGDSENSHVLDDEKAPEPPVGTDLPVTEDASAEKNARWSTTNDKSLPAKNTSASAKRTTVPPPVTTLGSFDYLDTIEAVSAGQSASDLGSSQLESGLATSLLQGHSPLQSQGKLEAPADDVGTDNPPEPSTILPETTTTRTATETVTASHFANVASEEPSLTPALSKEPTRADRQTALLAIARSLPANDHAEILLVALNEYQLLGAATAENPYLRLDLSERARIGRSNTTNHQNFVQIVTTQVLSRNHFDLWFEAGAFFICDNGSNSGTWVNGTRLSESGKPSKPRQIKSGDTLRIGVDFTKPKDSAGAVVAAAGDLTTKAILVQLLCRKPAGTTTATATVAHQQQDIEPGSMPTSSGASPLAKSGLEGASSDTHQAAQTTSGSVPSQRQAESAPEEYQFEFAFSTLPHKLRKLRVCQRHTQTGESFDVITTSLSNWGSKTHRKLVLHDHRLPFVHTMEVGTALEIVQDPASPTRYTMVIVTGPVVTGKATQNGRVTSPPRAFKIGEIVQATDLLCNISFCFNELSDYVTDTALVRPDIILDRPVRQSGSEPGQLASVAASAWPTISIAGSFQTPAAKNSGDMGNDDRVALAITLTTTVPAHSRNIVGKIGTRHTVKKAMLDVKYAASAMLSDDTVCDEMLRYVAPENARDRQWWSLAMLGTLALGYACQN